jgi:hypothetical protein
MDHTRTARPALAGDAAVPSARRSPSRRRAVLRTGVVCAAMLALGAVAGPASATHSHVITTPGTCVDKAGAGFGTDEPHGPQPSFHSQVHKGTPGLFAFENLRNPVSVTAGTCD